MLLGRAVASEMLASASVIVRSVMSIRSISAKSGIMLETYNMISFSVTCEAVNKRLVFAQSRTVSIAL